MKKNKLIDVSKYIFEDYFIFDILPAVNDEDSSSEGRMPWSVTEFVFNKAASSNFNVLASTFL